MSDHTAADDTDVLDALKQRRGRRAAPVRRPATGTPAPLSVHTPPKPDTPPDNPKSDNPPPTASVPEQPAPATATPVPTPATPKATSPKPPAQNEHLLVDATEATTHYGGRVRQSLDTVAVQHLHELRLSGITRSNKVELLELFLWELHTATPEALAERLQQFRNHAPRIT